MRSLLAVCLVTGIAAAHPPPPPELASDVDASDWRDNPARYELSTWVGVGFGIASSRSDVVARSTQPQPATRSSDWTFSAGADITLPLGHHVRVGPWIGLHDLEPMAGAEIQITGTPRHFGLFFYDGEGAWTIRAGGGPDHATAAITWGYRCPWKLWGPYSSRSRYEIGARFVLAATRAYDDPKDWSATAGIEVEPVGALRYLLGIKSLY